MDGDVTLIENTKLVSILRELLSTKEENVEKALLYRTVATGRDVIEKQHTVQEASYGRDALAKVIAVKREKYMLLVFVTNSCSVASCTKKETNSTDARRLVTFHLVLGDIFTAIHTDSQKHESQCCDSRQKLETVEEEMYVGSLKTSSVGSEPKSDSYSDISQPFISNSNCLYAAHWSTTHFLLYV